MATVTDDTTDATAQTVDFPAVGKTHPQRNECPSCGADLRRTGLNQIVYSFEVCQTHETGPRHVYEQMWHREHFLRTAPATGW